MRPSAQYISFQKRTLRQDFFVERDGSALVKESTMGQYLRQYRLAAEKTIDEVMDLLENGYVVMQDHAI